MAVSLYFNLLLLFKHKEHKNMINRITGHKWHSCWPARVNKVCLGVRVHDKLKCWLIRNFVNFTNWIANARMQKMRNYFCSTLSNHFLYTNIHIHSILIKNSEGKKVSKQNIWLENKVELTWKWMSRTDFHQNISKNFHIKQQLQKFHYVNWQTIPSSV